MEMQSLLAIDPGSQTTGFAVLHYDSQHTTLVSSGIIQLDKKESLPKRLSDLHHDVTALINKFDVQELALEKIFFAKNAKSALHLGQARGCILAAAGASNLRISEYSATQVKNSICGAGRADKLQIEHMIRQIVGLPKTFEFKSADHSDALAIGLTHIQNMASEITRNYDRSSTRTTHIEKSDPIYR